MALFDKIRKIDDLQSIINGYGQLDQELKRKIDYRFRLDLNYHSNAIEGGTLSKEETRSVMIGNIHIHDKKLRDVLEMKGHDTVIKEILAIGKGEKKLSEKRIKEIHKAIIHEEDPENILLIGQWKKEDNQIINYKLEKHNFEPAREVPELMHKLIDKTNARIDGLKSNPGKDSAVLVALEFHLDFINIHPFHDGNGRLARILTNLLLISAGYPPFIVRKEDKDRNNQLLADIQAYGGDPKLFYEFLCDLIIKSQKLVLDAIEGKDISESDDFEKELALLDQELSGRKELKVRISNEVITKLYENSLKPLFVNLETQMAKLDSRFDQKTIIYQVEPIVKFNEDERMKRDMSGLENQIYFDYQDLEKYGHKVGDHYVTINDFQSHIIRNISVDFRWIGYKKAGIKAFDLYASLNIAFDDLKYKISENRYNDTPILENLYDEDLTNSNIKYIVKIVEKGILDSLRRQIDRVKSS